MNTITKNSIPIFGLFLLTLLSSCELIGDIFKGGVYVGIILVLVVIGLVVWLISSMRK